MTITNQMRRKVSHGLQHHNTLLEITTNSILLLLPLGDISKTLVSKMLGIHPRTLQNLLNKNNLTYRDIVNSVRDTESKKLLTNSECQSAPLLTCFATLLPILLSANSNAPMASRLYNIENSIACDGWQSELAIRFSYYLNYINSFLSSLAYR